MPHIRPMYSLIIALTLAAPIAIAQETPVVEDHSAHMMATPAPAAQTSSTQAFLQANDKMHKGMNITFTGDADTDFIMGMIPHHQGAIDMAKVVIKHGKDPEVKMLANDIIKAQDKEIRWMQDWLELHGPKTTTSPATTPAAAQAAVLDSMESQIQAAQQKVNEIEKRIEAKPAMPMLEPTLETMPESIVPATTTPTTISPTVTNKTTKVTTEMIQKDTEKLMAPIAAEVATEASATIKTVSEKLDEISPEAANSGMMPEEDPTTFRQPGMSY